MSADMNIAWELATKINDEMRGRIKILEAALSLACIDAEFYRVKSMRLVAAIERTLSENGHLADGHDSTLGELVKAMEYEK
jgi:hypothetical protein